MEMQKRLPEDNRGRDPYRFNAVIGKDPETGRILMYVYCEELTLLEAFHGMPEVEEYGYWYAKRIPGGLSQEAWDARFEAWSRVWPPYEPPRYQLLEFSHRDPVGELLTCLAGATDEGNPAVVPPREDRTRNLVYPKAVRYLTENGLADEREAPHAAVRAIDGVICGVAPLLPELTGHVLTQGLGGLPGRQEYLDAVERSLEGAFRHLR